MIRLWTLHRATYRETKKKYVNTLFFKFSYNWKLSYPENVCQDWIKLYNIGLCWRSFRIFSQPRSQGSHLPALRSERERERESLSLSLRRAGRWEPWERGWSFPFVVRIVNCNVHHHGNNPGSMQWHIRWESRFDCKCWLVLSGQFSRHLAKNNENCLTYAKANHYFKTFWQFKSPFWFQSIKSSIV